MKLKGILLSTLAAVALFASTGAAANGVSIGWSPHGHVSYTITIGQPHVVAPQHRHRPNRHQHVNHHRQWRPPVKQHYRNDRRVRNNHHKQRYYKQHNQRPHYQQPRRHH